VQVSGTKNFQTQPINLVTTCINASFWYMFLECVCVTPYLCQVMMPINAEKYTGYLIFIRHYCAEYIVHNHHVYVTLLRSVTVYHWHIVWSV